MPTELIGYFAFIFDLKVAWARYPFKKGILLPRITLLTITILL